MSDSMKMNRSDNSERGSMLNDYAAKQELLNRMKKCEAEISTTLHRYGFEMASREVRLNGQVVQTSIVLRPKPEAQQVPPGQKRPTPPPKP